jgi:hypothetical protein
MMFKVKFKYLDEPHIYTVYCVRRADNGTTDILIYDAGEWRWRSACFYEPCEEEEA